MNQKKKKKKSSFSPEPVDLSLLRFGNGSLMEYLCLTLEAFIENSQTEILLEKNLKNTSKFVECENFPRTAKTFFSFLTTAVTNVRHEELECCNNSCICYVGKYEQHDRCPYCDHPRHKINGEPFKVIFFLKQKQKFLI